MFALLLATLLSQSAYYSPDEAAAIFAQGNEAYAQGEYKKARETFEKLIDHGLANRDVLYNAGTSALADNDLGLAVLYLERAMLFGGETADIEANLALARSKQIDQVVGAGTERTFIQRLAIATNEQAAAVALIIAMWIGFGALLILRIFKPANTGLLAVVAALSLIIASGAAIIVGTHIWVDQNVKEGVVLAATLPARELPRPSARVSFEVHAGLKLRVLESEAGFVKVRLPNGLEGWTERKGIADL